MRRIPRMISTPRPFARGVVRSYLARLGHALRRPSRLVPFLLAVSMHALGHALLALVAGGIAVAMARMWATHGAGGGGQGALAERAFLLSALGLAVVVAKNAAGVYATYVQGLLTGEVGASLRLELLDALLARHRLRRPRLADQGPEPPSGGRSPSGDVAALTERVHDVEVGLEQGLLGGVRAIAQLAPLGVVLVVLAPRMAAAAAALLVAFGALLGRTRGGFQRATSREARGRARLLEAADAAVRHADLWVTYGAEAKARARVRQLGEALAGGGARLRARAAAQSGANEVLGAAALVGALAASRAGWLGSLADGGTLLGFSVAFFLAYRPLRELADARLSLARADVAFSDLARVIEGQPAPEARQGEPPAWASGSLELRDLRLAHGACPPLSLRVEPGAVVAIAGPTGIGKTTLLRTLLGLEPAAGGEVLYGGRALGDAPAGPASRPFAWVPQEAPLLADTLGENVALGAGDVDAGLVLAPLGAGRLASELHDVRLGAGGRAVSGGERQWIALARAIATEQPVLLLDEPTSGLDPEAQRQVLDAIGRLRGKRTVLIVTHRPEPLEVADVVLRLEAA